MSRREKIIDDLARTAGETAGLVAGIANQAKSSIRSRIDELAHNMDLVPRADFERIESMLIKSRKEQEELKQRIAALESIINPKSNKKTDTNTVKKPLKKKAKKKA